MNSLDALISICFLCFGLALILGVVVEQEQKIFESGESLKTKGLALKCTAIIESSLSNNAEHYPNSDCYSKNEFIIADNFGKVKKIIFFSRMELESHYAKGTDFFD